MAIVITKGTCGGHPRIDSTRVEVFNIIGSLADGLTIDEIAEDFRISKEQVIEAINWTREYLIYEFNKN